jgi:nitroreductase
VPDEVLERALAAGIWAPNHHGTQPWRFTVLGPQTRAALADIAADTRARPALLPDINIATVERIRDGARRKVLSKPAIVAVSYVVSEDEEQRLEDFAATCCSIQNIQLAAWAQGLGVQWSTSAVIYEPGIYELLGIPAQSEQIISLLYMGFPAVVPPHRHRKPLAEVCRYQP